jgi:hypothetical protein
LGLAADAAPLALKGAVGRGDLGGEVVAGLQDQSLGGGVVGLVGGALPGRPEALERGGDAVFAGFLKDAFDPWSAEDRALA